MVQGLAHRPVIAGVSRDLRGDSWDYVPRSLFWQEDLDRDAERGFDIFSSFVEGPPRRLLVVIRRRSHSSFEGETFELERRVRHQLSSSSFPQDSSSLLDDSSSITLGTPSLTPVPLFVTKGSLAKTGTLVSLGEVGFLNFHAFLGGVAPVAKPRDKSESIEFESLPFVHFEYVESVMLVNRIPELMHVDFWNICNDEKCKVAWSESKSIQNNLKCGFSLYLSKIESSVAFPNLKSFLLGNKFQIKFDLLSSNGRHDSAKICHI
ncbi:hypothetical protein Tco_0569357 [Tanacetum coccineum]